MTDRFDANHSIEAAGLGSGAISAARFLNQTV